VAQRLVPYSGPLKRRTLITTSSQAFAPKGFIMTPAPKTTKIMIIRHAEKPAESGEPFGVTAAGDQDVESLTIEGWQRSGGLACLFAPGRGPLQAPELATPDFLFASESKSGGGSNRPFETITPLASKLGLTPTTHKKTSLDKVAAGAMSCGGTALISWQHEDIPAIANVIVGNETTVPQNWPGHRFDLIWVFDLSVSSGSYSFTQVPQLLLAGDIPDLIQDN
jgi:hypothetical protein